MIQYRTKRETMIARDAFVQGALDAAGHRFDYDHAATMTEAKTRYPMPTTTRPRKLREGLLDYVLEGTTLMCYPIDGDETPFASHTNDDAFVHTVRFTHAAFVDRLIDLIRNPTETVEVDA